MDMDGYGWILMDMDGCGWLDFLIIVDISYRWISNCFWIGQIVDEDSRHNRVTCFLFEDLQRLEERHS